MEISLTYAHIHMNVEIGTEDEVAQLTIPSMGIQKSKFLCSVVAEGYVDLKITIQVYILL